MYLDFIIFFLGVLPFLLNSVYLLEVKEISHCHVSFLVEMGSLCFLAPLAAKRSSGFYRHSYCISTFWRDSMHFSCCGCSSCRGMPIFCFVLAKFIPLKGHQAGFLHQFYYLSLYLCQYYWTCSDIDWLIELFQSHH